MDPAELRTLRFGAAFHDIGKLAIPGTILNKPGRLTDEERAHIERHTVIGEQILAPIDFLAAVRPLVRHGHERWDGARLPRRPRAARTSRSARGSSSPATPTTR